MEIKKEVITETRYRCPKCNRVYKILEEAEGCLSRHSYPEEIIDYKYFDYGPPMEITVALSDGSTAVYRM